MRTLIAFAALLASIALVQLGSGSLGPLDALAGAANGFSTGEIGFLGSAHFAGFFLGCYVAPQLMGRVGHARGFAAMAAIGAVAALLHPVIVDPAAWALMRVGAGLAVAGAYTIVESWLHAQLENAERGRVFSAYRVIDMIASVAAQGLVALLDPTSYVAYNIVATLCCLCLLPLTLTRRRAPPAPETPRLRPRLAFRISPLGAVTVAVYGLTSASFRMVGPIYAVENGLEADQTGLFMASGLAGGALAQIPAGWLSDRYDRRVVLTGLSAGAALVCAGVVSGLGAMAGVYLAAFAFGAAALPIYSIAAAHANDHAPADSMVELNAALMFLYTLGAIVSPALSARLIEGYGPGALFAYIGTAHLFLIGFSLWRMARRPASARKTPHRYLPRTSFLLGRLLQRARRR